MAEELTPKGGFTQRIRNLFGRESKPFSSAVASLTPLDQESIIAEMEGIREPDFGAKDYIREASKIGCPIVMKEADGYKIMQITAPFGHGELRGYIPNTKSEVDIVFRQGRVEGVRVISCNVGKNGQSAAETISIGIPGGEAVMHYDYSLVITGSPLAVCLGNMGKLFKELDFEPNYPEARLLRLIRLGGNLPADAKLIYQKNKAGEYEVVDIGRNLKPDEQGLLSLNRELSDGRNMGVVFPQKVDRTKSELLEQKLRSDTGWLNLRVLLPVGLNYSEPVPQG